MWDGAIVDVAVELKGEKRTKKTLLGLRKRAMTVEVSANGWLTPLVPAHHRGRHISILKEKIGNKEEKNERTNKKSLRRG